MRAGDLYVHKKGGTYEFVGEATYKGAPSAQEGMAMVVYRCLQSDELYVRTAIEFFDSSRFKRVDS